MIYYVCIGILYFTLTGFILITNNVNEPLYAIKSILIPYNYENNKIIFINLIINYSFIIIFIMDIIKKCGSAFSMQVYIQQRCTKKKAYIKILGKIFKSIGLLLIIKFIIDIILGGILTLEDFQALLLFYVLYILTLLIWILVILIFYLYNFNEKKICFSMIAIILIFQYLSFRVSLLKIFVIASKDILYDINIMIVLKVILIILLLIISYSKFKRYEIIGGLKND